MDETTTFPSPTTPGFVHNDPSKFLTELIILYEAQKNKNDETYLLPPHHWRKLTKSRYASVISVVRRTIKLYGWRAVYSAITCERIVFPTFASLSYNSKKYIEEYPVIEQYNDAIDLRPTLIKPVVDTKPGFAGLMD